MRKVIKKIVLLLLSLSFLCCSQKKNGNTMKITNKKIYIGTVSSEWKKKLENKVPMEKRCEVPLIIQKYSSKGTSEYLPPYISFTVNGREMQFLFDTGTPFSTISDSALEMLGIEVDQSIDKPCIVFVRNYRLNGKNMGKFYFYYIPGDEYALDANGTEIAGIIGLNSVISTTSFCIDYSQKKLILNDNPQEYENLERIPMSFDKDSDMKIKLHITVEGQDYSAFLDSGASCILSSKEILNVPINRLEWERELTSAGMETVKVYYANASEIRIGSTVIKNAEIMLWDDYALDYFPEWREIFKSGNVDLGVNGFLDRYKVWVLLGNNECLYIKPYE